MSEKQDNKQEQNIIIGGDNAYELLKQKAAVEITEYVQKKFTHRTIYSLIMFFIGVVGIPILINVFMIYPNQANIKIFEERINEEFEKYKSDFKDNIDKFGQEVEAKQGSITSGIQKTEDKTQELDAKVGNLSANSTFNWRSIVESQQILGTMHDELKQTTNDLNTLSNDLTMAKNILGGDIDTKYKELKGTSDNLEVKITTMQNKLDDIESEYAVFKHNNTFTVYFAIPFKTKKSNNYEVHYVDKEFSEMLISKMNMLSSKGFNIIKASTEYPKKEKYDGNNLLEWEVYCGDKTESACDDIRNIFGIKSSAKKISFEEMPAPEISLDHIILIRPKGTEYYIFY
jgi:hypothetical protein